MPPPITAIDLGAAGWRSRRACLRFRAPSTTTKRPGRLAGQLPHTSSSRWTRSPDRPEPLRDVINAGVLAMHGAKCIVHIRSKPARRSANHPVPRRLRRSRQIAHSRVAPHRHRRDCPLWNLALSPTMSRLRNGLPTLPRSHWPPTCISDPVRPSAAEMRGHDPRRPSSHTGTLPGSGPRRNSAAGSLRFAHENCRPAAR